MSYSNQLKQEIINTSERSLEELSGFVHANGSLVLRGKGRLELVINTENPSVYRHFFQSLKEKSKEPIRREKRSGLRNRYRMVMTDAMDLLVQLKLVEEGEHLRVRRDIAADLIERETQKRDFLRGVFLGMGTLIDPTKGYQLEIGFYDEIFLESFRSLLEDFGLQGGVTKRRQQWIFYMKNSESIVDFLHLMGATSHALSLEDIRIVRDIRNQVNRQMNCDNANLDKTLDASLAQVRCIELIQREIGIANLSEDLQEIALLRWEEQDLSLKELGARLSNPLSKSGVNHRLQRLMKICEGLRRES